MLTSLKLTNWQKHESLDIEFGPIACIVGASNAGKSSILRALRWVMTNKPTGNRFIKRGEKECRVEVEIDGHSVVRERGKDNCYYFDRRKYEALAGDVPDDVRRLFDISECNYQSQREGTLYWFALSDGEVAKELNKVVDLSLIDRVMRNINSRVRKQEQELDDAKQKWERDKGHCEELCWVEQAAQDVAAIEALRLVSAEKRGQLAVLRQLLSDIKELSAVTLTVPEQALEKLQALFTRRGELIEQRTSLLRLVKQIKECEQEVAALTEEWREETKALRDQVGKVCPTCRRPL